MTELGVGGLSVSKVARWMGMRGPSLYEYFPPLHALYDALFARGLAAQLVAMRAATDVEEPGVARLRAGGRAVVAWCAENPASAQLVFWRPVLGFEPSPAVFAASVEDMAAARTPASRASPPVAAAGSHGAEQGGVRLPAGTCSCSWNSSRRPTADQSVDRTG